MEATGLAVGVIALAIDLAKDLVWYVNNAKARREDKNGLLIEICASRGTLESLVVAVGEDEGGLEMTQELLIGENRLVDQLRGILKDLAGAFEAENEKQVKKEQGGAWKKGWYKTREAAGKVAWPFKKETLEARVGEMARLREALVAAMVGDTAYVFAVADALVSG